MCLNLLLSVGLITEQGEKLHHIILLLSHLCFYYSGITYVISYDNKTITDFLDFFSLSVEQEKEEGGKLHPLQRLCTHLAPQGEPRYEPYNIP